MSNLTISVDEQLIKQARVRVIQMQAARVLPPCGARRMAQTAADVVDHVIPPGHSPPLLSPGDRQSTGARLILYLAEGSSPPSRPCTNGGRRSFVRCRSGVGGARDRERERGREPLLEPTPVGADQLPTSPERIA